MTGMLQLVHQLPEQLRWAAELEIPEVPRSETAIVAGMGGSGIAADVAALAAAAGGARVAVHKTYDLPTWAGEQDLLVAVSHSGDTEETATSVEAALSRGMRVVVITTGGSLARRAGEEGFPFVAAPLGPQPRAAFGFLCGAALRVLEGAGIVGPQSEALLEAAAVTESVLESDGPVQAALIASKLVGKVTFVYGGAGVAEVAAKRWKAQINENAKAPAAWVSLPEANHNDIVGWEAADVVGGAAAVVLSDSGDHPRVALRVKLTAQLLESALGDVAVVASRGTGTVARLFSLTAVGDLVSVALAEETGTDPMPVAVIEELKNRLALEPQ